MNETQLQDTPSSSTSSDHADLKAPKAKRKRSRGLPDWFVEESKKRAPGFLQQASVFRLLRNQPQSAKMTMRIKELLEWDEFDELMMRSASERLELVRGILGRDDESFALVAWLFASEGDFRQFVTEATLYRLDKRPVVATMAGRARSLASALAPGHEVELNGVLVKSAKVEAKKPAIRTLSSGREVKAASQRP